MRFGFALRLMGDAARSVVLRDCALRAEAAGLDTLWVPDHIAIPPDQTEGSGGRYLDALTSLAWLAAATERIALGTAVLILPYRPALPTAKVIATIQELSGARLELGVGVGWMRSEFKALGVDSTARGRITDETLDFLHAAFDAADDEVVSNGQLFVFRPNPPKPRIWIGGAAPHALARATRSGIGWMPMGSDPKVLGAPIAELRARFRDAGRVEPEVAVLGALGRSSEAEDLEHLRMLEELGVTEFIQGARYDDVEGFVRSLEPLVERRDAFNRAATSPPTRA
jgi:probable F420-dependent oxidoreductase